VAVIVAVGVNIDGRREVLGMTVGHSEAEPFWVEFLRSLARRGLRGVKLVTSDAHTGLKAAISKVLSATWQRCRVHFMRNALVYAGKTQRRIVSAWVGTAFAQDDAASAGHVRQRGGKSGVVEMATGHAATVEIWFGTALMVCGVSSAIGSVCM
jgi:transposase-like protein